MVAVLGTLGYRPQSLIPTIRSTAGVDHVVMFISATARSREAAAEVGKYCSTMEIGCDVVELDDAFDLMMVAERVQDEVLRLRRSGEDVAVFNIAGGTRLMSGAALLVCILEGLNAVYVHDDTYEEIALPFLHMRYSSALTPMERRILLHILERGGGGMSQMEIAKEMGLHKATVNHHVQQLFRKGAVEMLAKEGDRRTKTVRAQDSMRLLLR
ncbi:MAG: MarR family transcriptional regulator [Methanomassiliicoccales archaeon]|nr:MarR family transcriptional regulator [Methanomassiliicoccales archaeon]